MSFSLVNEHPFGGDAVVRYFRLHNGLQLLLLVDRGAPIFTYQTWYGVGSRHEQRGKTGMAHLFEHLMFNQTANLPAGEFDRLVERVGGDTNAATWVDWTFYRDSLPASQLELAVRIESDRMANLTLDDDQLEAEREVVINERLMRVDDDVEGFLDEQLFKLAFTAHPYHWPTIGWMEDIRAIAKPDVHAFYRTYYAPNNATVVVVGDVDEAALLDLVERYYGALPAAELPAEQPPVEPEQTAERRATFSKPVPADRVIVGYKCPEQAHRDWLAFDLIHGLLANSASARLYKRLVIDTEVASSVDGGLLPLRDPSLYQLSIALTRGNTAVDALAAVDAVVAELQEERIDDDELDKVKNGAETDFWTPLSTVDGKAEALGHFHVTLGDYRALFRVVDDMRAIDAGDIQRVARTYLRPERRTVVIAEPGEEAA